MDEDYARKLRNWLRAEPGATPRRPAEEREWLREIPEPGSAADERERPPGRQLPGTELAADAGRPVDRRISEPGSDGTWSVRGQLPAAHPATDEEWICPVIALPVPRSSRENGCRMSEAEASSRRNHPTNRARREEPTDAPDRRPMSEAEARSRWNHPTNWHRRRREAGQPQRDNPGSR
ncbi:hypothetical protein DMA12_41155 [Amycolatopsis balhimycina DSM 5908]|uniref:Uncharacterized protein n=1 Tax=Amycolatopsis balhimycina DSM 5908 TaxID=1081091 RepID=A0A428VZH3_AMYBA|nr:hypothetical protein [Amycolatopsis balhimycina]RSM36219.1 hypothetical protein DMA12_41155 [Amycolatopsis balhimycina DSM 5908]